MAVNCGPGGRLHEFWQNASDPLEYATGGCSTEGLKMKSNELPFPLEQEVVDTSENPGRRVLKDGFIEAIGHLMWFSEEFWRRTGRCPCIPEWVRMHRRAGNVDFVEVSDDPFAEGDRTEELQRRVRAAFFPQDKG